MFISPLRMVLSLTHLYLLLSLFLTIFHVLILFLFLQFLFLPMSVKKTIQDELEKIRQTEIGYFNHQTQRVLQGIDDFNAKLDSSKQSSAKSRVIAVRNWLNHVLLWAIVTLLLSLLSSCFVSGRTVHISTPKVTLDADTATALSWPYKVVNDKEKIYYGKD